MPSETLPPTRESDDFMKDADPFNATMDPSLVSAFSNYPYSFGFLGNESEFPSRVSSTVEFG